MLKLVSNKLLKFIKSKNSAVYAEFFDLFVSIDLPY
jgi:hypothetical protein